MVPPAWLTMLPAVMSLARADAAVGRIAVHGEMDAAARQQRAVALQVAAHQQQ